MYKQPDRIDLIPIHGNDYYVAFHVRVGDDYADHKRSVGEVVRKYGRFVVRHNSGHYAEFDHLEACRQHLLAVSALED